MARTCTGSSSLSIRTGNKECRIGKCVKAFDRFYVYKVSKVKRDKKIKLNSILGIYFIEMYLLTYLLTVIYMHNEVGLM